MSNEIRINAQLSVRNNNFVDQFAPGNISINQANPGRGGSVQSIPTTSGGTVVSVTLPAGTANGYCCLRNLDSANYLTWGVESGGRDGYRGHPKPGRGGHLPPGAGVTLMALANAAAVLLDTRVYCN